MIDDLFKERVARKIVELSKKIKGVHENCVDKFAYLRDIEVARPIVGEFLEAFSSLPQNPSKEDLAAFMLLYFAGLEEAYYSALSYEEQEKVQKHIRLVNG